uniref:NAD-binding protein n=1 Tax=Klebsiella pneumoniae TaxID=573 RepID=UPI0027E56905
PLAVAVHAVRLAPDVERSTCAVLGLGTIGQEVVQVLRARGARRVIGLDVSPLRIDAARRLGADALDGSAGVLETLTGALEAGE